MFKRLRAAIAAFRAAGQTPAPTHHANTLGSVADNGRALQARTVDTVHMDTHHADTHHHTGGQVTNTAHGSVGIQARDITGATLIAGNSGIVNAGGTNSFNGITVGRDRY